MYGSVIMRVIGGDLIGLKCKHAPEINLWSSATAVLVLGLAFAQKINTAAVLVLLENATYG